MINTGWTGGGYGEGSRIELAFTRAMIKAALTGALDQVDYVTDPVFGLHRPTSCPDVPNAMLNPRDTWRNEANYDTAAQKLAELFNKNFAPYAEAANDAVVNAGPE